MKASLFLVAALAVKTCTYADVIAQWNFNSVPPDGNNSTGTNVPSVGMGTASLVGAVNASYSDGSTNDPASGTDDSGWATTHYPSAGTSNKLAGVRFDVSTLGYSNIVVRWDHRVSTTGSKYYRLQYTTNGSGFTDFPTPVAIAVGTSAATYYEAQTNSLAAFAAVNNNPNFGVRIVSEFEYTATGAGVTNFTTPFLTNNYSTAGTVRFDLVTFTGTFIPGANTPPTITGVPDQTIRVNHSTGPLSFTVLDAEDPATNLTLNAFSSDPVIIPVSGVTFGGTGANRTVNVAAGSQPGASTIKVWVTDTGGRSNDMAFTVTVLPANTSPLISALPATNALINTATPALAFTVSDLETSAGALVVSGSSSNALLVPAGNLTFGGSGSNRTVTVMPAAGQVGVAPLSVTVSDGTNTASSPFAVMITPSPAVIFFEPFAYPDGSLLTNSGFLWDNRSGTTGQCQVTNNQLLISADQSEDVVGRLAGAAYNRSNGTVLYAAFKLNFLSLPKVVPEYFAHFGSGTTLRARVYAGTTNATPGFFRLFIANGSDTNTALTTDLATNTIYTVVTRYNIDSATATLWLNPTAETDPSVTAGDVQSPVAISSYGFRQDAGLGGSALIDDLRIGLSFASVLSNGPPVINPIPLNLKRDSNRVILSWTDPAFFLQAAPAAAGPFTNVPAAASPFTNPASGPPKFFRLKAN